MSMEDSSTSDFMNSIEKRGFDISQEFNSDWYNEYIDGVEERVRSQVSKMPPGRQAILVGNSKAMWEHLMIWKEDQNTNIEHPVDVFSKQVIMENAEKYFPNKTISYVWSSEYAKTKIPMQRVAEAIGLAALDHNIHLCIHPKYGTWFALRSILILDTPSPSLPLPIILKTPLSVDQEEEAARLLKLALEFTKSNPKPEMESPWIALRSVPGIGNQFRYTDEQLYYHSGCAMKGMINKSGKLSH